MNTLHITTIAVEFPSQTTKVSVQLLTKIGIISKVTDQLTLEIPGIYQNLNSELFNLVLTELQQAGYDVQAGIPEDSSGQGT